MSNRLVLDVLRARGEVRTRDLRDRFPNVDMHLGALVKQGYAERVAAGLYRAREVAP
ncbi:MAG: hypothetical protein ABR562_05555 [Thermoplasmatota archaeon]|nr:hypothetical protein [Halobacteriales archaeon]